MEYERDVVRLLRVTEDEVSSLEMELRPLLEKQNRLNQRLSLLRDLAKTFGQTGEPETPFELNFGESTNQHKVGGSIHQQVVEGTRLILEDAGKPLHISEIHEEFLKRGLRVPGAGQPANLIAHLTRTDQVVSPARGIYGLPGQVGKVETRKGRK